MPQTVISLWQLDVREYIISPFSFYYYMQKKIIYYNLPTFLSLGMAKTFMLAKRLHDSNRPAFSKIFIDCAKPEDHEQTINQKGEIEPGCKSRCHNHAIYHSSTSST
jgi:hypothetical protein